MASLGNSEGHSGRSHGSGLGVRHTSYTSALPAQSHGNKPCTENSDSPSILSGFRNKDIFILDIAIVRAENASEIPSRSAVPAEGAGNANSLRRFGRGLSIIR